MHGLKKQVSTKYHSCNCNKKQQGAGVKAGSNIRKKGFKRDEGRKKD